MKLGEESVTALQHLLIRRFLPHRSGQLFVAILLAALAMLAEGNENPAITARSNCDQTGIADPLSKPAEGLHGALGRSPQSHSATRYVSAHEALMRQAEMDSVVVDLRRPAEVAALRIAGALNIPPHQVKTKAFLRGKRLLLADAGYRHGPAERTAAELDKAGFDEVQIIEGGLHAWHAAGGPLLGPMAESPSRQLSPADVLAEAAFPHWKLLWVAAKPSETATTEIAGEASGVRLPPWPAVDGSSLPMQLPIPAAQLSATELERLPATIDSLSQPAEDGLTPLVLIVDADGRIGRELLHSFAEEAPWNLFVLDGGLMAWGREQRRLAAMWAQRAKPPERSGACGL
ncbi:MAG TPA: rhodanese-like domain-containing protein [Chromatiaceae bacterium]|nr:MAG: hypothetical protein N838_29630 [Thiohalocapsa sp. PB-PSB1]HBG95193.1 rhodanese-like domain-containing protein [Chromatiaceae bacterium]HCS91774.1 rhodanese-like domain-containing protein [Chromatiaceae bacterium]